MLEWNVWQNCENNFINLDGNNQFISLRHFVDPIKAYPIVDWCGWVFGLFFYVSNNKWISWRADPPKICLCIP